ncbi:MAG: DUF6542 domain-containing protein [Nocardioides sp.]|jgi:hypothetical protein
MNHTIWDEGTEPGARVVALAVALALSVAVVESGIGSHLGLLFDLCFVMICTGVALLVHPRDFFAVGVLPPLLMLGVLVLFAIGNRDGLGGEAGDGFLQSVISALGRHAVALGLGYAAALACLAIRRNRILHTEQLTPGSATRPPRPRAAPREPYPTSR